MTGKVSEGKILALFAEWIVPHAKADIIIERLQAMREMRRNTRWDTEQIGSHILAPSHCGKSHVVNKIYVSRVLLPELRASGLYAPDVSDEHILRLQKKVIVAKVPAKPTDGSFSKMLVRAYDQEILSPRYTTDDRIKQAGDLRQYYNTELLVLERFDQLTKLTRDHETMKQAVVIQEIVKNMMEDGWPILLVGLPNAMNVIKNIQVQNRMLRPLDLKPLRFKHDMEEFYKFLAGLELLMLENGIFDEPSGLCSDYVALRLYYASQGRLGVLCKIVRDAAILASKARAAKIPIAALKKAVQDYPLFEGICAYNPFDSDDDEAVAANCLVRVAADERFYDDDYKEYFR